MAATAQSTIDARLSPSERLTSLVVGLVAAAPVIVAAFLRPDPSGIGTHVQLGIPTCTWPTALGITCPSCGMTTAFAHAAAGDLLASIRTQPMGFLLAVLATAVAMLGVLGAATGSRLGYWLCRSPGRTVWWVVGSTALASWLLTTARLKGWI
ncbi:MAG: DUF2752 domain-containing protein [Planctomycetes bacterium]|nr:DUF2752 domain-containing protein [Planctomycetota bacterium]